MDALSTFLRRYTSFVVRNHWLVLALIISVTGILAAGALRLSVEVDPDRELPSEHPYVKAFHEAHRLFGDTNLVVIGLQPTSGDPFSPPFLSKVQQITERLLALPGISVPLLQSIASPSSRDVRLLDDGLSVQPLMQPFPPDSADALRLKARVFDDPSFLGTIVSFDGTAVAIYATFELTRALPGYVNIHHAVLDVLRDAEDGSFTYLLSGPIVVVASLSTYASQVAYFFPIALLVIGLVHYDAFRTWQAVFLPLLTGLLAVLWALGLMGYAGVALDPFNSTTPVLILAVGAGHSVQILKRYYEDYGVFGDNHLAIVNSITRIGGVMIAAGAIAALSFLSLATLGTDSMRTFGILTAFGISSALVIELTTIPAMRAILPPPRRRDWLPAEQSHAWLGNLLRRMGQSLSTLPSARTVLAVYGAIVLVAVSCARLIEVDTSFKRNFSASDPVRVEDDALNQLFAGTNSLLFSVEGPLEGSIAEPDALRGIASFERRMEALPGVGKAFSVADTIERLHRVLGADHDSELPPTKDLATQYLFLYTMSGGNDLATRLTPDNRIAKIVVMLHDDSTSYGNRIISEALRIAREELPSGYKLHVAGSLASNSALTETIVKGKILNIFQITTITIIIASIVFRSWLAALLVAVPLAIAVLINFGVMGACGIRLDVATAAVSAMAVGIGADYAVYFLFRVREEYAADRDFPASLTRALETSGRAIVFVSTAVGIGYSVLCLSGFRLFVQLGSLVSLAMITSSLATLFVIPALLTLIADTKWLGSVMGASPHRSFDGSTSQRSASTT